MASENTNIGARSALKGYRLQFLYSLYRILFHSDEEELFVPEGTYEDLDIYDKGGKELELIQVKALSARLVLSDILSEGGNSFLRRSLKVYGSGLFPKIKLVSFGEVSGDIEQLTSGQISPELSRKLKNLKLNDQQILTLQNHFEHEVVDASQIISGINEKLSSLTLFADVQSASDLLAYWIYKTAEAGATINKRSLQNDLLRLAKFQTDQVGFHSTYGSLIRPLKSYAVGAREQLESDFYQGISASYEHILAEVDIIRDDKLDSIHARFKESNVVIVHGASGQGKSALAYRYLHDFCDVNAAYLLVLPSDTDTVYKIINTLEGLSKGLEFPLTIYLDISPGNSAWVNILVELSRKKQFNFLITIREEDWNALHVRDKFEFRELALSFDEEEAAKIYDSLNRYRTDLSFPDFSSAWSNFGTRGPLLEFVYLISQKESLPEKIKGQLTSIFNDSTIHGANKLKLLRYVSLADFYGAKVRYQRLADLLSIDDASFYVDHLKNEYLLQVDNQRSVIYGLHPIRSEIIKNILFKDDPDQENRVVLDSLSIIQEDGVESFLRNAFRKSGLQPQAFLDKAESVAFESWTGYSGALAALLWKGIDDFVTRNNGVLSEVYREFQEGWSLVVNADIAGVLNKDPIELYGELFDDSTKERIRVFGSRLGSPEVVMSYARAWLSSLGEINATAVDDLSWNFVGDVLFWINHFELRQVNIRALSTSGIDFDNIELYTLAKLRGTIESFQPGNPNLKVLEEKFLSKLYRDHNILIVEQKDDGAINSTYYLDIINVNQTKDAGDMHNSTMQIVRLLRLAYPDKKRYKVQACGHLFPAIVGNHDESKKDIPLDALPSSALTSVNSTFINLFTFKVRPQTWEAYVNTVIEVRGYRSEFLKSLLRTFSEFHRARSYGVLNDYVVEFSKNFKKGAGKVSTLLFPRTAVDQWGEISETKQFEEAAKLDNDERFKAPLVRYQSFRDGLRETGQCIDEFLSQSAFAIHRRCKEVLNRDVSGDRDYTRSSLVGNLYPAARRLSDFQRAFRDLFAKYIDDSYLKELEEEEEKLISALLFIYHHFLNNRKFLSGNIVTLSLSRLNDTEEDFKRRVLKEMAKFSRENNLSVRVNFEIEPRRVVITVAHNEPLKIYESIPLLYASLQETMKNCDVTALKYFIIDTYFNSFRIVPIVKGRLLNELMMEFMSYNLRDTNYADVKPFMKIPKPIGPAIVSQLNLSIWKDISPEINVLSDLWTKTAEVYQFANHLVQFAKLEETDMDSLGREISQKYVSDVGVRFSEAWQKCIDGYNAIMVNYRDDENRLLNEQQKQELAWLLREGKRNFYASDKKFEEGSEDIVIKLEELESCLPRLEKLAESTFVLYVYLSGRIINSDN